MMKGDGSLSAALTDARLRFQRAGIDDPAREARLLIGGLLGLDAIAFITGGSNKLSEDEARKVEDGVLRRLAHEPVYRILGWRPFCGLTLSLSAGTLEPRPDTEIIVDELIPFARGIVEATGGCRILDLGTGTGAICLALLDSVPGTSGVGADLSEDALETARRNADLNNLRDRFEAVRSDWFEALTGTFDIIVSNPPYIASAVVETLSEEVKRHDPRLALDGGEDGLDAYRSIAAEAKSFLRSNGVLAFEIGYDQKAGVIDILAQNGFALCASARDLGGNDRCLVFRTVVTS
ncbi:peptide chain release factor N(5)-glutamine methyltransferase [Sinorhizobium sp. BG8]|uniref:peptide chain release factor N(5)-glutamine methyltransferase n=1 Tax=Sinorhizobium sp. BG8 TaxID=2613773 RepID=UPI00193DD44B|nr:peptide chain release factor N(5)-glutamine methyltransferase [Sinorhizobium sp. BG8]QRM53314.1 peptide chain release factor N(5)-glutamine methyltransferase [Sinorhizobium sp. BG8]